MPFTNEKYRLGVAFLVNCEMLASLYEKQTLSQLPVSLKSSAIFETSLILSLPIEGRYIFVRTFFSYNLI